MLSRRQNEIIEKSIELISESGIQGLTIKNLSHKLNISEPAIYRHFPSKNRILMTILDGFRQFAQEFSEQLLNAPADTIDKLNLLFSRLFTKFAENPTLVSVIFSEEIFKNDTILLNKISEIMVLNEKTIKTIIEEGQKEGQIRNDVTAENLAIIVMGAIRVLVKKWDIRHYEFDLINKGVEIYSTLKKILQ